MKSLGVDPALVIEARETATRIAAPVLAYVLQHTTVAVERTTLRLLGVDGADARGVPYPNLVLERAQATADNSPSPLLSRGISAAFAAAMLASGRGAQQTAEGIANGTIPLVEPLENAVAARTLAEQLAAEGISRIDARRREREEYTRRFGEPPTPWLYVIVATGNIYEDILQASAAARQGADVIAVIRSTAQSLLDYVPYGATTEGFGGTYATQENFRLMRAALDQVSEELGRYVRLTNYCSGLCMPEIASMGALERLDMMLNDALYGIIFRDINMRRTLIDQFLSRRINARAGIIINTGEDNYLTTDDAFEAAHTVVASQFVNERLALAAGLPPEQIGLGHAFEMDPDLPNQLLWEIAGAALVRELFPLSPIKYMPPTKHMTGDIFQGHLLDGMFNLVGVLTGQGIQLLGMPTEAIHTPLLQDRFLAIRNAHYVFNAARDLGEEITWRPDGMVVARAQQVLADTVELLHRIEDLGLFRALEAGLFANIRRSPDGGRGQEGVFRRAPEYFNPCYELLIPTQVVTHAGH